MSGKHKKSRQKNLTEQLLSGELDDVETEQRFSQRSSGAQQRKIERTALLRAAEESGAADARSLPVGQVVQVYSLFYNVEHEGVARLCVMRKTLAKLQSSNIITGDYVRFRELGTFDEEGRPEGVIEEVLPRKTVLTRADSFKAIEQDPIVANAGQMLIVASLRQPPVKWGLVDRMIVAAQAGGLRPIVCLNKIDLSVESAAADAEMREAEVALAHYRSLGIDSVQSSVVAKIGFDRLREVLAGHSTVLAGHSGVGKSSLIHALDPNIVVRIGAISGYTGKGIHTTTSARIYKLTFGAQVIDTPGVKLFGLWNVTADTLIEYFPDVAQDTAPDWRRESYGRVLDSLGHI